MFFQKIGCIHTKKAYLGSIILKAPFWSMYNLLLFILYKDLHATPFQISLFIALRPMVSIFSVYWGSLVEKRPDRIKNNVVWASFLGFAPFLFFPWIHSAGYLIFASAIFMMMHRGVIPAWMELFKRNLPGGSKHGVFSLGAMISHLAGAIFPLFLGHLLDRLPLCWQWMFPLVALLGLCGILIQLKLPNFEQVKEQTTFQLKQFLLKPWLSAFQTLKAYPYFRLYLFGFTVLGGTGIMVLQPALPHFFVNVLSMNYTELGMALSVCKGIGFFLTSPFWAKKMPKTNFFVFCAFIALLGSFFPLILLGAQTWHFLVFGAYLLYGALQAGSEMTWHLAAPFFSKDDDSAALSNLNILTVGIKGCFIPYLATTALLCCSATTMLLIGSSVCLSGVLFLQLVAYKERKLLSAVK